MRSLPRLVSLVLALVFALAACATPVGNLLVIVTGLPGGENASIRVTGPNSYSADVTETTTLTGLTPGTYTVSADNVSTTAVTSEYSPTVTPSTVAVTANDTATVAVEYALDGGSLDVTISGLPSGADADVTVSGPLGFSQDLTASTTISDLDPGEYSASANPVTVGSNDYTPTVSGSPAEVSSNSGATITVSYEADPGSLSVTVAGITGGASGDVTVSGPGGFSQNLTSSTTIIGLEPGSYTVSPSDVRTDDPVVSEIFRAPADDVVEVTSNTTANSSITYSKQGGTGRLWRPLTGDPLLDGYTSAQLGASGTPTPDVAITVTGSGTEQAVVVDGVGNAWVSNNSTSTISRYDAAKLEATATVTADVTIGSDGTSLSTPVGLAFDPNGNLWVAALAGARLEMFTPAQLATSGTPTPTTIISTDGTSLAAPCGLAFDQGGNLWVTNLLNAGNFERFTPAQLATSGTPTPDATISNDGTSLNRPCGLALASNGNLWVTAGSSNRLEGFTPGQIAASGTPTPAIIISSDGASLSNPFALAFDNSGNLWVNNGGSTTIEKFAPAQLATNGSPTPAVAITGNGTDVGAFAFSPPPLDLPINAP